MASNVKLNEEYDFVEKPGKEYFCPVTFELLKDPRQTNLCCGNHLSGAIAERLEAEGKPCPICNKEPLKTTDDLFFKRKVMELKVRCGKKAIGCKWVGELRHLGDHLKMGSVDGKCGFIAVDCPLKCGERIQRRNLTRHRSKECSKRPFTCKYCDYLSTHDKIVNDHWQKCQRYPLVCPNNCSTTKLQRRFFQRHLKEECPLQEIECEFSHAGCQVKIARKYLKKHLEECKNEHLEIMAVKCTKLEALVTDLQYAFSLIAPLPIFIPPPEMIMDNFEKHKNYCTTWYSPTFNTHIGGYNMCFWVNANGQGDGKGTHLSLAVYMMKGDFDSHLKWPFRGEITVELVNQKDGGENHVGKPLEYTSTILDDSNKSFQRVTDGNTAKIGWGLAKFIAHTDLYKPEEDKEYLLNDTLIFKITNVKVTI